MCRPPDTPAGVLVAAFAFLVFAARMRRRRDALLGPRAVARAACAGCGAFLPVAEGDPGVPDVRRARRVVGAPARR